MFSLIRRQPKKHAPRTRSRLALAVELLEDRCVPSTFKVLNLNDSGADSLRQAMLDANASAGPDLIQFDVVGTIQLTSGALPTIVDEVDIDGASAPGFTGRPLLEINYNGFAGLHFNGGSSGSALRSLALVNASNNGVTLHRGGDTLVVGNFIGLGLDGITAAGNHGNGVEIGRRSTGNTIGGAAADEHNIISGNLKNGIRIRGSSSNQIVGNHIGTDVTGNLDRGNAHNGILVTARASGNLIGGDATGGNDPTNSVFVRPPDGNLISGNDANGVLITGRATQNQLSGNFIGTTASGNAALGNSLDGVAFVRANNNSLIGCTFQDNPFVFYNVISGNAGNGLRVTNSDNTTIQANFFGLGADNSTAVGNALNGVVIEGNSSQTVMGGPIPLGNVVAANVMNGIVVQDRASFFTTYNTFCGLAAFSKKMDLGNGLDGMLITSRGGNILIRTNVIARNGDDGIEISGNAHGVRVAGNIIGLDTQGDEPMGNIDNGVEVGGRAHQILIGGLQRTFNVIPHNVISANGGHGVAMVGAAHDNVVNFSFIGTNLVGEAALGNAEAGVLLGPGTRGTRIGSPDPGLFTVISGNHGNGVEMRDTHGNTVIGVLIGTDPHGKLPLPNASNGVFISNSFDNVIGRIASNVSGPANLIAFNDANGVFVESGSRNGIHANSIHGNTLVGIDLAPGANLNQAAPVLTTIQEWPLGIQITGTLTSTANTTFTIEFFANDASETSGRYYLGSQQVKTNAQGVAVFEYFGPQPPDGADVFTATATDPKDNTSEFSEVASLPR